MVHSTPAIQVDAVTKSFGRTAALRQASLVVDHGSITAMLGPSGSGKTTLLRLIAGFDEPDEGTVTIGGRGVAGPGLWVEPEQRRVGMVFQDGALFPHLTVGANVAFGRPRPGVAESCLDLVGLSDRSRSYPHELSGGERQRVALARALAIEPDVVLLDEPFASLDAGLRASLRDEVTRILREAEATAVLVTHDQDEALSVADTVAVMSTGRVEQVGTPDEVYHHPRTRWVATFLGAADVLPGVVSDGTVECDLGTFPAAGLPAGAADVVVRPESLLVADPDDRDAPASAIAGRVVGRSFHGSDAVLRIELTSGRTIRSRVPSRPRRDVGDAVSVWVGADVSVLPPTDPVAAADPVEHSAHLLV